MTTIWIIMLAIFCVLGGYAIGVRRGFKTYETEYDKGYKEGFEAGMNFIPPKHTWIASPEAQNEIIRQLDELFDDEEDEGFTYGSMYFPPKKEFNEIHRTLDNETIIDCGSYD